MFRYVQLLCILGWYNKWNDAYLSVIQLPANATTPLIFGKKGTLPRNGTEGGPVVNFIYEVFHIIKTKVGLFLLIS